MNRLYNVFAEESYYIITGKPEQCFSTIIGKTEKEKNSFIQSKIEYIESLNCTHYLDSVSLICQDNNIERFVDNGYFPNVITLRRDPREVALSYYKLDWDIQNPPLSYGQSTINTTLNLHQYQKCLLYCFEIEKIAQKYKTLLPSLGIKHYEITLNSMLNKDNFNSMLSYFDMPNLGCLYTDKINALDEDKYLQIDASLMHDLEQQLIENIKDNNDLDVSLRDIPF
jgi:hypothetical protein